MLASHSDLAVLRAVNERSQHRTSLRVLSRRYESAIFSYMLRFHSKPLTSLYEIETPSPNLDSSTVIPFGRGGNCAHTSRMSRSHAPREIKTLNVIVNGLFL